MKKIEKLMCVVLAAHTRGESQSESKSELECFKKKLLHSKIIYDDLRIKFNTVFKL